MRTRLSKLGTAALMGPLAVSASSQFHLSLVGSSSNGQVHYMLDWVAASTVNASQLAFGTSADSLDTKIAGKAAGLVAQAAGESVTCWSALLANLEPGTTVFYALEAETSASVQSTSSLDFNALSQSEGNGNGASETMNFTVPNGEITWAVFGDMGAPMQKHAAAVSLPALKSALAADSTYSGVLNIGDLSYELVGANGQNYLEELQDITSQVPMMTTVGNHEYQYSLAPDFAVQNYYRRFHGITLGAGAASGSSSNEFYSFSSGRIHFAFINTEIYGDEVFAVLQDDGVTWKADEAARLTAGTAQAQWLEYDLSRVDRSKTPFVVVCGHRPPFKTPKALSEAGNRFAKEIIPVMSKYQVDLYLSGHEHTYLVFEASTFNDCNVPPIIISGSPGNNEYIREEAQLQIVGFTWKTLIPKYGYGYLSATEDALEWQWGSAATDATHEPTSAMWTKEDAMTFPRQGISGGYTAAGKAVSEPVDVTGEWTNVTSASTSGSSGTVAPSASASSSGSGNSSTKCFPSNFLFGSATSAYQVEGGVNSTGRTPSVWDTLCAAGAFECANVADDFIDRYQDDIATMKSDGHSSLRFSISWSRAMTWNSTTQRMQPNPEGLAFYHSLVDELLANGMEPLLTLFHWDTPAELYEAGDFLNATIIDHFTDFAQLIFTEFGQQVKFWSTINEPLSYMKVFYIRGESDTDVYDAAHNLLLAHAQAVALFRNLQSQGVVQSSARIGMVLDGFGLPYDETVDADVEAAERYVQFSTGWFLAPITTGDYPPMMRERVGSRLPTFTADEAALLKGSYDLFMSNHYYANLITDCDSEYSATNCSDLGVGYYTDLGVDHTQMPVGSVIGSGSILDPTSCTDHGGFPPSYLEYIRWVHAYDTSADILLTENGWCGNETIDNQDQLWYFRTHLEMVHKAIYEDDIPIIGYTAWSFFDNFEWASYAPRYGLYYVDFPDNIGDADLYSVPSTELTRTPRTAAKWYADLATTGCFETDPDDEKWLAY
ncbi:hypothetical protein BBJ28_00004128 [Nothophytophthora sp. Chile5]|nr:hypothetical protein BBJ28_00004128 [Nothophytophthora sp. Chile5]